MNKKVNFFQKINSIPLWPLGLLISFLIFLFYGILGEATAFPVHDQLDETILSYLLNARHIDGNLPEMMNGLTYANLQPSAILFIPLYAVIPFFGAFLFQYAIEFVVAFLGMYACVKLLTNSSIQALVIGVIFSMLPILPVYGLCVFGIPMALYSIINLKRETHKVLSLILLAFYGLTSHLVLTGYVLLGFWILAIIFYALKKESVKYQLIGFLELTFVYLLSNIKLIISNFGKNDFVSHREEFVLYSSDVLQNMKDLFINGISHVPSLHKYLILPIIIMLLIEWCFYKKLSKEKFQLLIFATIGFACILLVTLFSAIYSSEIVTSWRNASTGVLKYFQADRVTWIYPVLWLLTFSLCAAVIWNDNHCFLSTFIFVIILLPTVVFVGRESYLYMNIRPLLSGQQNNISWQSFYSEDLFQQIEDDIGRDMSTYRIAHIGMNPTPAIVHGFYTIDGYSNNYSLEYKHKFRQIISDELELYETKYYDEWGSRCYLFNSQSGDSWMNIKYSNIQYSNLHYNMSALSELGCEYLFSAVEILDYDQMNLEFVGCYDSYSSCWRIWVYHIVM